METIENILQTGNLYTAEDLEKSGCILKRETSNVIFWRKNDTLYVFDLFYYKTKGKYKLLSIIEDD